MKRKRLGILVFAVVCVCFTCITAKAEIRERTTTIGSFKYTYTDYASNQIWITQIEPVSDKGISTLKIPASLEGKDVVKLGWKYDTDDGINGDNNLFGIYHSEDDEQLKPEKIIERVAKIEKIVLPATVKNITPYAFTHIQDGKTINVPGGVTKNVDRFCETKWKKFSISSTNKKYKVENGLLLSKDGKVVYGSVVSLEKVVIPDGVEKIKYASIFWDDKTRDVYVPASVDKIKFEPMFFSFTATVKFHVSAKNLHYAEEDNCIYSKKTGRLVAASAKDSTFIVPKEVTLLSETGFSGVEVKKFVIPATVKKIDNFWCPYRKDITYVFKGKIPPIIEESFASDATFYVPKGCKKAYERAVEATEKAYGDAYDKAVEIYEVTDEKRQVNEESQRKESTFEYEIEVCTLVVLVLVILLLHMFHFEKRFVIATAFSVLFLMCMVLWKLENIWKCVLAAVPLIYCIVWKCLQRRKAKNLEFKE